MTMHRNICFVLKSCCCSKTILFQPHNAAADAAAGVGSAAAAAAAKPDSTQKQYHHVKEACQLVNKSVKEVFTYCLTQTKEGQLCGDVLNSIQGQLCGDVTGLESVGKPLLSELIKAQNSEQSNAVEFLNNAPSINQLKALINHKQKAEADQEQV